METVIVVVLVGIIVVAAMASAFYANRNYTQYRDMSQPPEDPHRPRP